MVSVDPEGEYEAAVRLNTDTGGWIARSTSAAVDLD
jgi:hypothetical protein